MDAADTAHERDAHNQPQDLPVEKSGCQPRLQEQSQTGEQGDGGQEQQVRFGIATPEIQQRAPPGCAPACI
ncbi:MAG: hypothetical protein BWY63_02721 [Chloroflexi bacterium ADurb.Bin360]|nr:MAG: hypothetical protein BWY63_02721 [Chloroflexi bacterium ADurb.Bin360]